MKDWALTERERLALLTLLVDVASGKRSVDVALGDIEHETKSFVGEARVDGFRAGADHERERCAVRIENMALWAGGIGRRAGYALAQRLRSHSCDKRTAKAALREAA